MSGCERKAQESSSSQSPRLDVSAALHTCWDPEDIGFNASERTDLLARWEQAGNEKKLPSSMSLGRLPAESVTQIRNVFSQLEQSGLKVCLPASRFRLKACFSQLKRSGLEVYLPTSN